MILFDARVSCWLQLYRSDTMAGGRQNNLPPRPITDVAPVGIERGNPYEQLFATSFDGLRSKLALQGLDHGMVVAERAVGSPSGKNGGAAYGLSICVGY